MRSLRFFGSFIVSAFYLAGVTHGAPIINSVSFFLDRVGQNGSGVLIGVNATDATATVEQISLKRITTQPAGPWVYTFNYSDQGSWLNWNYNSGPSWWDVEDLSYEVTVMSSAGATASTTVTCPLQSYLGPVENISATPGPDGYHIAFDAVPNATSYTYGVWKNSQLQYTASVSNPSQLSILPSAGFAAGELVSINGFAYGSFPFSWDGHAATGSLRAYENATFVAVPEPSVLCVLAISVMGLLRHRRMFQRR